MPAAPTEAPQEDATASHSCQPPLTNAVLPILELDGDNSTLCVYYDELEALAAAQERTAHEFFDIRGYALKVISDDDGDSRLETSGEAHVDVLRGRVLSALTATTKQPALTGAHMAQLTAVRDWVAGAPDLGSLVNGLGLGPVAYAASYTCQPGCSAYKRTHPHPPPPCCPGF